MSEPWLQLCQGRACIGCGIDDGTIVPAHSNQQAHGKGMGLKSWPFTQIPLCMRCHLWLDNGQADRLQTLEAYTQGWVRHMTNLLIEGEVVLTSEKPGAEPKRPKLKKMLDHPGVLC